MSRSLPCGAAPPVATAAVPNDSVGTPIAAVPPAPRGTSYGTVLPRTIIATATAAFQDTTGSLPSPVLVVAADAPPSGGAAARAHAVVPENVRVNFSAAADLGPHRDGRVARAAAAGEGSRTGVRQRSLVLAVVEEVVEPPACRVGTVMQGERGGKRSTIGIKWGRKGGKKGPHGQRTLASEVLQERRAPKTSRWPRRCLR